MILRLFQNWLMKMKMEMLPQTKFYDRSKFSWSKIAYFSQCGNAHGGKRSSEVKESLDLNPRQNQRNWMALLVCNRGLLKFQISKQNLISIQQDSKVSTHQALHSTRFSHYISTQYGQQKSNEHQKDMRNTITALK